MLFSKRSVLAVALALSLPLVSSQDTSLSTVKAAFDSANIPADAFITFDPTALLEVSFAQASGPAVPVHAGETILRNQTANPPTFGIRLSGSRAATRNPFVVAMVDLDAPTPQNRSLADVRHFLGGNFYLGYPGLDSTALLSNKTPAVSEFQQPSPPAGSAPHRYTFLLFEQSAEFNSQTLVNANTSILSFNISSFAAATGLGQPIGGTYMLVGPDASS